jgi:hypothetical protein
MPRNFVILFILALATASSLVAEKKEILFDPPIGFPAEGGPAFKACYLPAGAGTLIGGRGEVVIKGAWGLGFGSYSLASEMLADQNGVKRDIGLSYGGLEVNYSFLSRKLLFFNVETLVGPGQAYAVSRLQGATREYLNFWVAEPEINVMINVTSSLRLGVGAGYRLVTGADYDGVIGSGMGGPSLSFTIMYGKI